MVALFITAFRDNCGLWHRVVTGSPLQVSISRLYGGSALRGLSRDRQTWVAMPNEASVHLNNTSYLLHCYS